MSFVAAASIDIDVPPQVAFDTLADHQSWKDWMPRSFIPVSRATSPLPQGEKIKVKVAGAPIASRITVTVVDRPREITWCGGVRGMIRAEHRFLFESNGRGGTTVRSHETWYGVVAAIVRPLLKRAAEKVGREQLEALASACLAKR